MVETPRTSRGAKGLAVALGVVASLGSPARAFAQTTWSFPDEPAPAPAPTAPPAPNPQEAPPPPAAPSAAPPPAAPSAAAPPAAEPPVAPPPAAPPPPSERFPVTFSTELASVQVRGPGIEKPLTCLGACTFSLARGTHWLDIQASGRTWTQPIQVNAPESVVIDTPSSGARGLGIAAIIVGGLTFNIAAFTSYVIVTSCGQNGNYQGSPDCRAAEKDLPYWLAATGVGGVVTVIGVLVYVRNNKPSVDVVPAFDNGARREPGTFVGLGPVDGSTLPGLSLRTSF